MEQFKLLFPLKGEITQEIIDSANIFDIANCIGALTLKSALGENLQLVESKSLWGSYTGFINLVDETKVSIGTIENTNFMNVTKPQLVTFIIES